MLGFRYLFLCGVLASLNCVNGLNNEEMGAIRAISVPFMMVCGKDYGVTEEDFKAAKEAGTVQHLDSCFLSCVLKRMGMFNSKGMFDKEIATVLATTLLSEEKQKALEVIETCTAVNDQVVSDGDKGCERAKLWIECYMPLKGALPGAP